MTTSKSYSVENVITEIFSQVAPFYNLNAIYNIELANDTADFIVENLPGSYLKQNEINIFEIGCGTGFLTKFLIQHLLKVGNFRVNYLATDSAPGMIGVAKNLFETLDKDFDTKTLKRLNLEFQVIDFERMESQEFQDRNFSLVVSAATFQLFSNLKEQLKKAKVFSKNGIFAASIINNKTFSELLALRKDLFPEKMHTTELFSGEELVSMIKETFITECASKSFADSSATHSIQEQYGEIKFKNFEKLYYFQSAKDLFQKITKLGYHALQQRAKLKNSASILSSTEINLLEQVYQSKFCIKNDQNLSQESSFTESDSPVSATFAATIFMSAI